MSEKFEYLGIEYTDGTQTPQASSLTSPLYNCVLYFVNKCVGVAVECFRLRVVPIQGVEKDLSHRVTVARVGI